MIEICIPCGPNSEDFANFLIKTVELTSVVPHSYIFALNKNGVDKEKILSGCDIDAKFVERVSNKTSSAGHADALNLLLEKTTSDVSVFVDSDVAFLKFGWDEMLLEELTDNVVMIGSSYHKTDKKPVDRPNVITCAFKTRVLKDLRIDFTPSLKWIVLDETSALSFGGTVGDTIFLDTGCDMISTLIQSGFRTKVLEIVSPRYKDTVSMLRVLDCDGRGEEYHLRSIPICTHIGRSLSRSFNSDTVVVKWKNSVLRWLDGKI